MAVAPSSRGAGGVGGGGAGRAAAVAEAARGAAAAAGAGPEAYDSGSDEEAIVSEAAFDLEGVFDLKMEGRAVCD